MRFQPYLDQLPLWPKAGRHILAQHDQDSIIVYQAYRPEIALHAVEHQKFGGPFSFNRMSWIKPNFLWMMYRAGWATKEGQEHILAVRIPRRMFDDILAAAVASTFGASRMENHEQWQVAVARSEVRLQWDPDHNPSGNPVDRRAVQLGLRGKMLRRYAEEEVLSITDVTPFVIEQHAYAVKAKLELLVTPEERIYHPASLAAAQSVGLDDVSAVADFTMASLLQPPSV